MNDRLTMPSAMTAHRAELLSDRDSELPHEHRFRAVREAEDFKRAADNAYATIRDDNHISDILNEVRDGDGKHAEFDGQLARIMREFPAVAGVVGRMAGVATEPERIALVAVLQACARIERLLFNEAHADEIAALDREDT